MRLNEVAYGWHGLEPYYRHPKGFRGGRRVLARLRRLTFDWR